MVGCLGFYSIVTRVSLETLYQRLCSHQDDLSLAPQTTAETALSAIHNPHKDTRQDLVE